MKGVWTYFSDGEDINRNFCSHTQEPKPTDKKKAQQKPHCGRSHPRERPGHRQNNAVRMKEGRRPTSKNFASASPSQALEGSDTDSFLFLPTSPEEEAKANAPYLVSNEISCLPLEGL